MDYDELHDEMDEATGKLDNWAVEVGPDGHPARLLFLASDGELYYPYTGEVAVPPAALLVFATTRPFVLLEREVDENGDVVREELMWWDDRPPLVEDGCVDLKCQLEPCRGAMWPWKGIDSYGYYHLVSRWEDA